MKKRLLFTVFISVLLISTTFAGVAANVRLRKIGSVGKIEHLLRNKALSSSEFSSVDRKILTVKNVDTNTISTLVDRNTKPLQMFVNEDINVENDGTANIAISMTIPSSILAQMYREMLGAPLYLPPGEEMDIPDKVVSPKSNIVSFGKKAFYRSILRDQWFSLGISVRDIDSKMIPFGKNNEFKLYLHAVSDLSIEKVSDGIYDIILGPSAGRDENNATLFISASVAYVKLMLNSIDEKNMFTRNWVTRINPPNGSRLVNIEELESKKWRVDFGDGTFLESYVNVDGQSVVLVENMVVTSSEKVNPVPIEKYKLFRIKCFIPDFTVKPMVFPEASGTTILQSEIFNWTGNLSNTIEGEYYTINYYVSCDAVVEAYVDLTEAWIKPHFHIAAGFTANFSTSYEYESDPIQIIPPIEKDFLIPYGSPVPLVFHVSAGPEFKLYFKVDAGLTVTTGAWVDGWFKAGAKYSFFKGFDKIWETSFSKGYDPPMINGYGRVEIKPVVSFPVKILYYFIGPKVAPEVYLQGVVELQSNGKLLWGLKLGFDIRVGVVVGIPYFWELSYDWPVVDYAIAEWSQTINILDQLAPQTSLRSFIPPRYASGGNWYAGPYLFFYFQGRDRGDIPSGLDYTMMKIDNGKWMRYNYPDIICLTHGGILDYGLSSHTIKWYSVDKMGNRENVKEWSILLDLQPPSSWYTLLGPHSDNTVFANQTKIILQGEDENSWRIWYRIWNKRYGWSEWVRGGECEVLIYTFPENMVGKCYVEWYAEDGVWNFENVYNQTFYVKTPPKLKVDSTYHDFGIVDIPSKKSWVFNIKNLGDGTLSWHVFEDKKWLSIDPAEGSITDDGTSDVEVTISTMGLEYNKHYNAIIRISSNGGSTDVHVEFDTGETPPKLELSMSNLFFKLESRESDTEFFEIRNSGQKTLDWSISGYDDVSWITFISPTSGSISGGKSIPVQVAVSAPNTLDRDYSAMLYVVSNGGNRHLRVHLRVMGPELYVSSNDIRVRLDPGCTITRKVVIKNVGDGKKRLEWSLTGWENIGWINSVSPSHGSISSGGSSSVSITLTSPNDEGNNYAANLKLSSTVGSKNIPVRLHVNGPAILHVVPTDIKFILDPYSRDEKEFIIKNFGEQMLQWHVENIPSWVISVTPDHGSIAAGKETSVRLNVKAPGQPAMDIEGCIVVRSNVGDMAVHIVLHVEDLTPDLEVGGYLDLKCKPGELVTGSFKVRNAGKEKSLLDWRIVSWPEFGSNWSFDQMQGYGLKPEDGDLEVSFSFNAPDNRDHFEGCIWVENMHDGNDFALVHLRLSTPKNPLRYPGLNKVVSGYLLPYQKIFKSLNYYNCCVEWGVLSL